MSRVKLQWLLFIDAVLEWCEIKIQQYLKWVRSWK